MNYPPISLSPRRTTRNARGFTLVEMMTAITVLSLMLVMLGQILQMASQAWTNGLRNVNNFTKARAMLDMFTRDLQSGVFRSDLAAFPGSGTAFYTERPGILTSGGSERQVSLVQYDYGTDTSTPVSLTTLRRGDQAIGWNDAATTIPFGQTDFTGTTVTPRDTAPGVLDYKVLFIYADGTSSATYTASATNPLRAVGFTLLVVDDKTLNLLSTTQIQTLRTQFDAAVTGTRSVKADWEKNLATSMVWSSYPKSLGLGLKIFERYVPVTGF